MNYYNIELARGISRAGIEVLLYTSDETAEGHEPGIRINKFFQDIYGPQTIVLRGARFARATWNALRDAREHRSKVLHLHFFQYGPRELLCCVLGRYFRFRIVATVHDVTTLRSHHSVRMFRAVCKRVDRFIVHNQFCADALSKSLAAHPDIRVEIIPHGHYLAHAQDIPREQARHTLGLPGDRPLILFFGQVKRVKGLDLLLRAYANYLQRGGDALLLVAGRQPAGDREFYRREIARLRLDAAVWVEDSYIPDDRVSLYYAACNLVVLPYREIYQSGVLLMAMSHGRAVLASDLEPMKEVIEEFVNGLLFGSGNVDSLSASLAAALRDTGELDRIGARAKRELPTRFDWTRIGQAVADLYRLESSK